MFAVVRTGGKQYRVAADEKITVMSLAGEPGDKVTFEDVLMSGKDGAAEFGAKVVIAEIDPKVGEEGLAALKAKLHGLADPREIRARTGRTAASPHQAQLQGPARL